MKTILAALEFPPALGGVETYYGNLEKYWPDELIVVDNKNNQLLNPRLPFLKWLPALRSLYKAIRGARADWVIIGEILPLGTVAWILSHLINFKYAVFLHGLDFSLATRSSWKKRLSKKILTRSSKILCVNSKTAEIVKHFLSDDSKIYITNPGADSTPHMIRPERVAGLRANYGLEQNFVLLTIARLVARKGIEQVLSVLPSVIEMHANVRYVIIGRGPEEAHLKQLISDPSLSGKVFLLTDVPDDEKWTWLEICDAFVMPTHQIKDDYEGFGIVYLEANLAGKPVIAAQSGGVGDAVINGINGLLIAENDSRALFEAITKVVEDPELTAKLGEQGRERVLKDFTWPEVIKRIHSILLS